MSAAEKFVIVPFDRARGGRLIPGDMRLASSEESAVARAPLVGARHAGAAAYAVTVDEATGDMLDPRLLVACGCVPELGLAA